MNNYRHSMQWVTILLVTMLLFETSGCRVLVDQPTEIEKNLEIEYYSINPKSILEEIGKGETDIFVPLEELPKETSSIRPDSVPWNQEDFYKVAYLLHQQSAKEPFGEYKLYSIHFSMNCNEIEQDTFSYASFSFFTLMGTETQEVRAENTIAVDLTGSWAATYQAEYDPNIRKRKVVDLADYLISAETAFQIAENNGGAEKRLVYGNSCLIDAITPAAEGTGWKILYVNSQNTLERIFEVFVDAKTGMFKVISVQ